jgi:hypothetical protein
MPEVKFPTPDVNLLAGDELDTSPQGKFVRWALTWGRRIVVLTELVVILAFISRFWLDTTVASLNDKIEQKRAVVSSFSDFEDKYRAVLGQVDEAKKIEKYTKTLATYDQILNLTPGNVAMAQMTIDEKRISFNGSCEEAVLSDLVDNFRNSASFSAVTVERIAKAENGQVIEFSLRASYGVTK